MPSQKQSKRRRHACMAEFRFERGNIDSCIEPESEKPRFFMLAIRGEPRGFCRARSGKVRGQVIRRGKAQHIADSRG